MDILLFGPPGAGKGTQSALLVDKANYVHISTGDLFRYNIKNNTELGQEAKKYMNDGNLVPDTVTANMLKDRLARLEDGSQFILDGYPRTMAQAEGLESLLGSVGRKLSSAVFLDVDTEDLISRLSGRRVCSGCSAVYHSVNNPPHKQGVCDKCDGEVVQRPDDSVDAIQHRLQVYEDFTAPLKEFYQNKGLFKRIDGAGSTDQVYSKISSFLVGNSLKQLDLD